MSHYATGIFPVKKYGEHSALNMYHEFTMGDGFADLAFIPRKAVNSPAIVAELKYDKSAEGAISQIKEKKYTESLIAFSGDILLVGINYDKSTKRHEYHIDKIIK